MAEYPINKGIGRPVEFKGLKAQYLFIFCGGLLALFVLFVILYMVGIDQWICIGFGAWGNHYSCVNVLFAIENHLYCKRQWCSGN